MWSNKLLFIDSNNTIKRVQMNFSIHLGHFKMPSYRCFYCISYVLLIFVFCVKVTTATTATTTNQMDLKREFESICWSCWPTMLKTNVEKWKIEAIVASSHRNRMGRTHSIAFFMPKWLEIPRTYDTNL